MRLRHALVTGAFAVLLAGCAEDDPEPVSAATLPDNLCAAVPDNVVARWNLAEADHATTDAADRSEASCSMTGTVADVPVSLDLSLTSYGGADADAARALAEDDLAARCDDLDQSSTEGRFESVDGDRCSTEVGGTVTEISRAIPARGVVTVTMSHDGQQAQLVPAEVVGIAGVVGTTDPADL